MWRVNDTDRAANPVSAWLSLALAVLLGLCPAILLGQRPTAPASGSSRAEAILAELGNVASKQVFIVAHRADWRNFPENSLPALDGSVEAAVDIAEIDIQQTKDGELVVMHDATLDRTTTGKGAVAETALAEIRILRLRDGLGSPTAFPVPTLREALIHAGGRITLNLDKSYRHLDRVLPILRETKAASHVLLKGSATIDEVRTKHGLFWKEFAYMPVINLAKQGAVEALRAWLEEPDIRVVELVFDTWTPEVDAALGRCRERGVKIWVNTLWPNLAGGLSDDMALTAPDAVYGRLLDSGVTIFQTDRPALLTAYLRSRGLRP